MSKEKEIIQKKNEIKIGEHERRTVSGTVEYRMDEAEGNEVFGYAAEIGVETELWPDFFEEIAPGAFDDVLDQDVRALFNHDANLILARSNNSLQIGVDERGLWYRFAAPNTTVGSDLKENLRLQNVTQSSFGFIIEEDTYRTETRNGRAVTIRTIIKVKTLLDVSPVTYPAYVTTEVSLRKMQTESTPKEEEQQPKPKKLAPNWRRQQQL